MTTSGRGSGRVGAGNAPPPAVGRGGEEESPGVIELQG